jgi:biotin carboxyl carrier protein
MLTIEVNGKSLQFDEKKGAVFLDGKLAEADLVQLDKNKYHLLFERQSVTIELLERDETGKQFTLQVNNQKKTIQVQDQYDALLNKLGLDKAMSAKANQLKAPMPGLVLSIQVKEGDTVQKGDALLVLEAMKMENLIKATAAGTIKKIWIAPKQAVEKNALLIDFE